MGKWVHCPQWKRKKIWSGPYIYYKYIIRVTILQNCTATKQGVQIKSNYSENKKSIKKFTNCSKLWNSWIYVCVRFGLRFEIWRPNQIKWNCLSPLSVFILSCTISILYKRIVLTCVLSEKLSNYYYLTLF